jgi:hypothetical protein
MNCRQGALEVHSTSAFEVSIEVSVEVSPMPIIMVQEVTLVKQCGQPGINVLIPFVL